MEIVWAKGLKVAYERVGEGPPLVFVHGAAEDGRVWQPQVGTLADEFTVVAWDEPGMAVVELQHDGAAPREAGDVRRAERERLDHCREAVRVVRQPEPRRHIGGASRPRLVPGDDRELIGQSADLRLPHAAILGGAMP